MLIYAGTPADKLLAMMSDLLEGIFPSIDSILFIQVRPGKEEGSLGWCLAGSTHP